MSSKIKLGDKEYDLKMTKYVHSGVEVILTGRTAERRIESKSARVPSRIDILHEIEPADKEQGSFKKWVRLEELYKIKYNTQEKD